MSRDFVTDSHQQTSTVETPVCFLHKCNLTWKIEFRDTFPVSDEAWFHVNLHINRKNSRNWGPENPNTFRGGPLPLLRIRGPLTENNWTHFVRRNSNSRMLLRTDTEFRIRVGKWRTRILVAVRSGTSSKFNCAKDARIFWLLHYF